MSRIVKWLLLTGITASFILCFKCATLDNPFRNPDNASLEFVVPHDYDTFFVADSVSFRIALKFANLIDSVVIEFHDGSDTNLVPRRRDGSVLDTVSSWHQFAVQGRYSVLGYTYATGTVKTDSITVFIKVKPVVTDSLPPLFTWISGPINNQRVLTDTGTLLYRITDSSGIDSVYGLVNDSIACNVDKSTDSIFHVRYHLNRHGINRLVIHAIDSSAAHNAAIETVSLNYNSPPSIITPVLPVDGSDSIDPSSGILFKWSQSVDPDGDSIKYLLYLGSSGAIPLIRTTGNDTVTIGTLLNGKAYDWFIKVATAMDTIRCPAGGGYYSFNTRGVTQIPPPNAVTVSQPTNVTTNSTFISWTRSTDTAFISYSVYRGVKANVTPESALVATISNKSTDSLTVTSLSDSTQYFFRVYVSSRYGMTGSNEVSATTGKHRPPVLHITVPSSADSVVIDQISVDIGGDVTSETTVTRIQATLNGNPVIVSGTDNWQMKPALLPAKWNTVILTATNQAGENAIDTVNLFCRTGLDVPSIPRANGAYCTTADITWDSVAACDRYLVYRSAGGANGVYSQVFAGAMQAPLVDTGLTPNTGYWYKIKGYYSYQQGSFTIADTSDFSSAGLFKTTVCYKQEYGGSFDSTAPKSLVEMLDRKFILTSYHYMILQTDSMGNVLWMNKINLGMPTVFCFGLTSTTDGGFAMSGQLGSLCNLVKTNNRGDTLFTKTYGRGNARGLVQSGNGDFLLAGCRNLGSNMTDSISLIRTDINGRQLWQTINFKGHAYAISKGRSSGYVVAGEIEGIEAIIRFDESGSVIWSKQFTPGWYGAVSVANDGTIAAVGSRNDSIEIAILSDAGTVISNKTYGNSFGQGIAVAADSGFITTCNDYATNTTPTGVIMKINSTGIVIWVRRIPDLFVEQIIPTHDGGYALVGALSGTIGGFNRFHFIKTDSKGISE